MVRPGFSWPVAFPVLLAELRQRQQTPDGRAKLRERVAVEHALAHAAVACALPFRAGRARP
jgi:hypothetical protein